MKSQAIIKQLDELRDQAVALINSPNPVDPVTMSDLDLKLAVLNTMLGDKKSYFKKAQIDAEAKAYRKALEEGMSATAAKESVRHDTSAERTTFEYIETKHRDVWNLSDVIRTYISAKKEDIKRG